MVFIMRRILVLALVKRSADSEMSLSGNDGEVER